MPLKEAVRRCYEGRITQVELAKKLRVNQNAISRWVTGVNRPSLEEMKALEEAAGRRPGFILRAAGFVEDDCSVEGAIMDDPGLSEEAQRLLLAGYRSVLRPRP